MDWINIDSDDGRLLGAKPLLEPRMASCHFKDQWKVNQNRDI